MRIKELYGHGDCEKSDYNQFIAKYAPTVFVVGSPFQVMCAVEAIRDFEITDYIFYAVMGRTPRDSQTRAVLNYFNINYIELDKYNDIYPYKKRLLILKSNKNRFHRAFVGGYGSMHHYFMAMRTISNNSVILTLDDGVETITLLKGSSLPKPANILSFINDIVLWIAKKKRHIELRKKLYTIYSDIHNDDYMLFPNTLGHLYVNTNDCVGNGIYFAGTTHESFYTQMGIDGREYFELIRKTFRWITKNYPNERKTYIPHGTDSDIRLCEICKEFNFDYIKPKHNIELFMCEQLYPPKVIVAFTSSCLLNLKRMFPYIECINVVMVINGKIRNEYEAITEYYEKNDIMTLRYEYPDKKLYIS